MSTNTSTNTRAVPVRAGLWRVIAPTGALAGYIEARDAQSGATAAHAGSARFTASRVPVGTARRIPIGTFRRLEDALESMR